MSRFHTYAERLAIANLLKIFEPLKDLSTRDWAETYRFLSATVTTRPGKMDCSITPWMIYLMECLDNPEVHIIVGKKSAQISWTETINNWLGRTIHLDPRNIMIVFPRAKSASDFFKEKLKVFLESTKVLSDLVGNLNKISHNHIPFPNGFLKLVTAGSADALKSSVIHYIIVEEPTGVKEDVNNQGDGMSILKQRFKSVPDYKIVFGGTCGDENFCQVHIAYEQSNKMEYMVPCHECGEFHSLTFDNLKANTYSDNRIDPKYGIYDPSTAFYQCPHCYSIWTFEQKNQNVSNALNYFNKGWTPTNPEVTDVYGFAFNELLSCFKNSNFTNLMQDKLAALVAFEAGKEGLMKSFINNRVGLAYSPRFSGLDLKQLIDLRTNYPEKIIPYAGLVLTAGIDVQHNRFAIVVRAWGRDNNSWLVEWTEIFGNVLDGSDIVWEKLDNFLTQKYPHVSGKNRFLKISAATIDSADGNTAELVYKFCRNMQSKGFPILPGKGVDDYNESHEIYSEPVNVDLSTFAKESKTLAETLGVVVYKIGAHRAHEEVLRRLQNKGVKDRHYFCKTSYGGYEEQILSCVKKSKLTKKGALQFVFVKLPNADKEAIDCEKMALHAAKALKIDSFTTGHWARIEEYIHEQGEPL